MNNLRKLRLEKKLNQTEFAKEINAAQNTVSQWELGTRDIDSERLKVLADYFEVTTDYILGRTDDPTPPAKRGQKKASAVNTAEAWNMVLFDLLGHKPTTEEALVIIDKIQRFLDIL